jgi:hypothetical protein
MNKYFQFEPVRFSAAVLVLGQAILAALYFMFDLAPELTVLLTAVWSAAIGFFNSFVVREQVTPMAGLSANAKAEVEDAGSISLMDVLIVLAIIIAVWVILKFIILN